MASLYLHIPFCARKCAYCDFPSFEGQSARMGDYVSALTDEMRTAANVYGRFPVETVFFGGGTPSLLSGSQLSALMDAVRANFGLLADAEITMEANPGTVTEANLAAYRLSGVNRLSIGVQSFDDGLLRRIGRIHTRSDAVEAVKMAYSAGFDNLSLDLIYGLPGQDAGGFLTDVLRAKDLGISHLSLYALILEPDTPLHREAPSLPSEEEVLFMQHGAQARLSPEFIRYEISNYAKPGMECRHNLVYWARGEYLGLGCGAHSYMRGERFANPRDLAAYFGGARALQREAIDREAQIEEVIMLSTRTREGIDLIRFEEQFGINLLIEKAREIERLQSLGLVDTTEGRLHLTDAGFDVHNAIVFSLV